MKFSIKNFLSKCDQNNSFLSIWSHLLKKPLMEIFIFFIHCKINDEKEMSEENSLAREIYRRLRGLSPRK